MPIQADFVSNLTITDTCGNAYVSSGDPTVSFNGLNASKSLTGSTTPAATKYAIFSLAMTAGAATIDLTSLPDRDGNAGAVDLTGLKIQFIKLRNKSTNANAITVAVGASDGYELGGADWSHTLQPGQSILIDGNDATPDVASGDKELDVSGTGAQVLEVEIVAG